MNYQEFVMDRQHFGEIPCTRCSALSLLQNAHVDGKIHRYWFCTRCTFAGASSAVVRANYFNVNSRIYDRRDVRELRVLQ